MSDILKPEAISGFPEFLPEEQMEFNRLRAIIVRNYELFGFLPLETPEVERLEVLWAKASEDERKLIYGVDKIIDGHFHRGAPSIAMPFDLTVPLARYVAMHYGELDFPFRRYQIQKVHRGERTQSGREREFYQADIDVIGNEDLSLLHDAEIPAIIHGIFSEMGVPGVVIRVNNRKVHNGLLQHFCIPLEYEVDRVDDETGQQRRVRSSTLSIIDDLPKTGSDRVERAFRDDVGLEADVVRQLMEFLAIEGSVAEVLGRLKSFGYNDLFAEGVSELSRVMEYLTAMGVPGDSCCVDLAITRGLNYYTGIVYETTVTNHESMGSVCSGGRYDNLASYYIKKRLPGVGISIGLTRLFELMRKHGFASIGRKSPTQVVVFNMSPTLRANYFELGTRLRAAGIKTEVYLEDRKIDRQTKYASRKRIPFGIFMDDARHAQGVCSVRDYDTGSEEQMPLSDVCEWLHRHL
jgi:histidyl-tRNA synthetase